MVSLPERRVRVFVAVIVVGALAAAIGSTSSLVQQYQQTSRSVARFRESFRVDLLRTTAPDGTPLKALAWVSPANYARTNHSVPVVFVCHGLNSDYLQNSRLVYTLARRGFLVVSVETRGHSSNPAPLTLGYDEPGDFLAVLDHVERTYACANVSAAGLVGTSLGGLTAMGTYIQESLGRGRFKAAVTLAGPVNVTREVAFYLNNPAGVGAGISLFRGMRRNPVDLVNATFPRNVLIIHGTADTTVDYNCSVDLHRQLDPTGTRDDVLFLTRLGDGHEASGDAESCRHAIAWIEARVLGRETPPTEIVLLHPDLDTGPAGKAQVSVLLAACLLVPVLAGAVYLTRPPLFTFPRAATADPSVTDPPATAASPATRWLPVATLGTWFLSGVVGLLLDWYLLLELLLPVVGLTIVTALLYGRGPPEARQRLARALNVKTSAVWLLSIVLPVTVAFLLTGIPALEDATLVPGLRVSWWIPCLTALVALLVATNLLVFRFFYPTRAFGGKGRLIELGAVTGLVGAGAALFLVWVWDTEFYVPQAGLAFPFTGAIILGLTLLAAGFVVVVQVLEKAGKTLVPGCVASGLVVALVLGTSTVVFLFY